MKKIFALILTAAFILAACSPSNVQIRSLDDLENRSIGVQQGTTGDIYAEDLIDEMGVTLERFKTGAEAILSLKQSKIDAVIIDDQPARVFVSQNSDLMILDEPFEIEDYAIAVSKDNPTLTAAMNGAIAELKADGTLKGILDYYIGQVEGSAPYKSPEGITYPNGRLVMATNAYFPPYEFYEGGQIVGVDPDFARAICDRMGYELVIEDMDFDTIIVAVQTGKADFGAAGMSVTEDRLAFIDFTDPYVTATQVIIVRK